MIEIVRELSNAWVTWWMAGLLLSFRMIVPARNFLSERSSVWLSHRLTKARSVSVRRRFDVSFKRYVDRTFKARQVKIGTCRIWTLRYRSTAIVSLLTFFIIFVAMLLTLDLDQTYAQIEVRIDYLLDPSNPRYVDYGPTVSAAVRNVAPSWILLFMTVTSFILFGFVNTITDYISFFETRNFLARQGRGLAKDISLVIADFVVTTLICILCFTLSYLALGYASNALVDVSQSFSELLSEGITFGTEALTDAFGMLVHAKPVTRFEDAVSASVVLSTYATSAWVWVYFTSTLLMRSVVLIGPLLRLVSFLVDVEEHPFRAAWMMFAVLWSAGIMLYAWL